MVQEKLHSVKDVAALLPVKISSHQLYFYLKRMNIVSENRAPLKEFIDKGYLTLIYGSKCSYSRDKHPITRFTDKGIDWLLNELYPEILRLEASGYFDTQTAA